MTYMWPRRCGWFLKVKNSLLLRLCDVSKWQQSVYYNSDVPVLCIYAVCNRVYFYSQLITRSQACWSVGTRATSEKSAFYFSYCPFWFSGTMPSYCMTVLWKRRSKVHSSLIFVLFFVLHSVIFSFPGNWVPESNKKNNNEIKLFLKWSWLTDCRSFMWNSRGQLSFSVVERVDSML